MTSTNLPAATTLSVMYNIRNLRFMDQELYKFRATTGHKGPLKATAPNWKGSKWNVQIEWETGEVTFEPLSVVAADDPITCAAYAKEKNLYNL